MKYPIGEKIKKYREKRNLTQSQLAQLIGITSGRLFNWEKGLNRPDIDMIAAICNALEISADDLLGIKTRKPESVESKSEDMDMKEKIAEMLNKNPDEDFEIGDKLSKYKAKMLLDNLTILSKRNKKELLEVLKELNIHKSFVNRLKKTGEVSTEEIKKLAEYFKVSANYLANNKIQDYLRAECSSEDENYMVLLSKNGNNQKFLFNSTKKERIETILKASFPEIFEDTKN